jgi:two-component system LytT family response regulator
MSLIRVLIADDEPLARRGIRNFLNDFSDVEICGEARHGAEAVRLIQERRPDLVFLDVQMPEADGFEVLRQSEFIPAVIFITAYDAFAVKAFDASAVDYLVKPVHEARFRIAFEKMRNRLKSQEALELSACISALLESHGRTFPAPSAPSHSRRIIVMDGSSEVVLDPKQIIWIEAEDYYAAIHVGSKRYLLRESLSSLSRRLDRSEFSRVHRTALVNLAHVREISVAHDGQPTILLNSGTRIPMSRRRRAEVYHAVQSFAGRTPSTSR